MGNQKSVLIICSSDLSKAPRVIRQIIALKDEYKLYTLGTAPSSFNEVEHIKLDLNCGKPKHWQYALPLRKAYSVALRLYHGLKDFYLDYYFENDYWNDKRKKIVQDLQGRHFDVIIAHHWDALPLANA